MSRKPTKRHFFDGEPGLTSCAICGEPYESARYDHDFGKLINPITHIIRPFTASDAVREEAELAEQDRAAAAVAANLAAAQAWALGSQVRYDGHDWTVADYLVDQSDARLVLIAVPPFEGSARISIPLSVARRP